MNSRIISKDSRHFIKKIKGHLDSASHCQMSNEWEDKNRPGNDFKGRLLYEHFSATSQGEFRWNIHGSATAKMTLNATGLTVN